MKQEEKIHLETIVKDELQKIVAREVIDEAYNDKYKFHRHPIFTIIMSFLMTGVIGAGITYYVNYLEKTRELKQQALTHLNSFNKDLMSRRIEAGYMRYALMRKLPIDEIKRKKESYDRAVKKWRVNILSHNLIFRNYFHSYYSTYIERDMTKYLISKLLSKIDTSITESYDAYIKEYNTIYNLKDNSKQEDLGKLLRVSHTCGIAFSNHIYDLISRDLNSDKKDWNKYKRFFQKTMKEECK